MTCAFCGEGDRWIKTCRALDRSRIRVCDPYWEVLAPCLVVVPGDAVVAARCGACGAYFNPREMAEVSPGGRHDAYLGTCGACAKVGVACQAETLTRLLRTSNLPPVLPVPTPTSPLYLGYRG
jgi:hypothetical protein